MEYYAVIKNDQKKEQVGTFSPSLSLENDHNQDKNNVFDKKHNFASSFCFQLIMTHHIHFKYFWK